MPNRVPLHVSLIAIPEVVISTLHGIYDVPLAYVQQLRIEDAKRRLERTRDPLDEISWRVGYEDPAFFRRLFKRITGISPGSYRRQFQIPAFAGRAVTTSAGRGS